MKRIQNARWLSLALGALVLAGSSLRAEPSENSGPRGGPRGEMGGGTGGDRERPFEKIKAELGLTDEQAAKLREHRQAHRQAGLALWQDARAKREALRAELEKPNFDENKVKSLQASARAAQEKLQDHRLQGIIDVKKILTPEQFAKFQTIMKEKRGQWGNRRGGGFQGSRGAGGRRGGGRFGGRSGNQGEQGGAGPSEESGPDQGGGPGQPGGEEY
ncbi:MAG: Spy/CpxP family protein refolding chaperone [Elusimicrobia bacterium]|nr:Spy/CpxP family protein refolding chaperone [Elusimicrobiota bacterium]